ncbi:Peptidyl-prolyl cis-trans isomerase E [Zancudomyces culisetae]|uniref:Peptidyl-prolyl cis-trans isomerase E n=1 Tax=Zancudomyces culisetae TaxID=1213189 RepID=A0A1R1PHD5_ZANCU|nr:Peptidyl-prolyl cis-trans isomerase E [Zancudomyces culisetae]|eukprot:OMH80323.1 Peptidyl-prolyl cis-trans isomerase E [Zancudomyces culisetae]
MIPTQVLILLLFYCLGPTFFEYLLLEHRGFGFIEFEEAEDANDAIDNMNNAELFGKTINVNLAKSGKYTETSNRAVWDDEEWIKKHAFGRDGPEGEQAKDNSITGGKNSDITNPRLFLEVSVDGKPAGRIELVLRADVAPRTAE